MISVVKGLNPQKFDKELFRNFEDVLTIISIDTFSKDDSSFIDYCVEQQDKILLNCICSGYGKTSFEKQCSSPLEMKEGIQTLLLRGFPASNVVLDINPVIQNKTGLDKARKVLDLFRTSGVYKVHLSKMFQNAQQKQETFKRFKKRIVEDEKVYSLKELIDEFKEYTFFTCNYENESCKFCIPPKLLYQLTGCLGTQEKKECISLTEDSIIILDNNEDLLYRR